MRTVQHLGKLSWHVTGPSIWPLVLLLQCILPHPFTRDRSKSGANFSSNQKQHRNHRSFSCACPCALCTEDIAQVMSLLKRETEQCASKTNFSVTTQYRSIGPSLLRTVPALPQSSQPNGWKRASRTGSNALRQQREPATITNLPTADADPCFVRAAKTSGCTRT